MWTEIKVDSRLGIVSICTLVYNLIHCLDQATAVQPLWPVNHSKRLVQARKATNALTPGFVPPNAS